MDVIKSVNKWLSTWTQGGEQECRNFLVAHHSSPEVPASVDVVFTAHQTLLFATLTSWGTSPSLSHEAFTNFIQSVLDRLPSSSSGTPTAALFNDQLVDMIWSVDAELDEIASDAKVASNTEQDVLAKAKKAKQRVELDKEAIVAIVKMLMAANIISARTAAERFDTTLLASVRLFPDKSALDKKEVRTRTGLFYKQNKFNLLREQSEGYSKLSTELTSSLGPAHSTATARPTESFAATGERARSVWEKIISLIGYFDLDPNRALDIILDIFSTHLTTHYSFFLALLSFSPWRGLYQRVDGPALIVDEDPMSFQGKSLDEILTMCGSKSHSSRRVDQRPSVLAQVLGFKFAYYSSPDVSEPTPRNLYLMAALLIRESFITLEDLYPHLSLNDANMDDAFKAYKADVSSRISAAKVSTLAMAAPLESASSSSTTRSKAAPSTDQKLPAEVRDAPTQKSGLISAFLALGAIKPALWILAKHPWMVDAHPEIADLLIRLMRVSVNPVYESVSAMKTRTGSFLQPRNRYNTSGISACPPRKQVLTVWAPPPPCTHTTEFVFFFPDWMEHIPLCRSLEDLMYVIEPLLKFIKLHIARDAVFMAKLLRLGRKHVLSTTSDDPSDSEEKKPIRTFWLNIMRSCMLPGLSLLRGNAVVSVEVWNIIKQYEMEERWSLYGEWKSKAYDAHTELSVRRVEADRESKAVLRRLSHKTIDSLSGSVAKLAHSNPCIFFPNVVNQIMAYDNLAAVVILGLHYVTVMGFDVLVYVIIDALSNTYKERVKSDGVNISDWLSSLASFSGMLFRRYNADLAPILSYVAHQLQNRMTTEMVVLRELMIKMAGIKPLYGLSDRDIAAMAGGPALRIEVLAPETRGSKADPHDNHNNMRGPMRLGNALVNTKLATPLLILLAQQRQSAIFSNGSAHLKSLGSLYDTMHEVLMQYLELLTTPSVVAFDDYVDKVLPSLGDLASKYYISPPMCMQVLRPVLHDRLLKSAIAHEQTRSEAQEKRLKATLKAKQDSSVIASRVASPSLPEKISDIEKPADTREAISSATDEVIDTVPAPAPAPAAKSPWLPELEALFQELKLVLGDKVYNTIGPGFYLTFWQLSSYDLMPPTALYDDVLTGLYKIVTELDRDIALGEKGNDKMCRMRLPSNRVRRDRHHQFIRSLNAEYKDQTISRGSTIKRLSHEKHHWFAHAPGASTLVEALLEHCIIPRCLLSPMDADYTAQMIRVLQTSGTPGFKTMMCYNVLFGDMPKVLLFSCSEFEAKNYGRFLRGLLGDLNKWHADEKVYLNDNSSKIGDKIVHHPGFQIKGEHLSWPEFHKMLRKWHQRLVNAFVACIDTGEFMHVYNAILVLNELLPVFPLASVAIHSGKVLSDTLTNFLAREKRGDLMIIGKTYASNLKAREAAWAVPDVKTQTPASAPPVKPRNAPPTGPGGQVSTPTAERRNNASPATSGPTGPRGQNFSTPSVPAEAGPNIKMAIESIPRPTVIKRTQREHDADSPRTPAESTRVDRSTNAPAKDEHLRPPTLSGRASPIVVDTPPPRALPKDTTPLNLTSLGRDPPKSPRGQRATEDRGKQDITPAMPPPAVPSQTQSAQELRETARQTSTRLNEKGPEEKSQQRPLVETRGQNTSGAVSPTHRSLSPSSRPGTRNSSADSRSSRPNRKAGDVDEKKGKEREPLRRDSVTHIRTSREKDGDKDRERDRGGRDRHDGHRERERDKERDRERERDRASDSRDRHRRGDDKDRERKDRDGNRSGPTVLPVESSRGRTDDVAGTKRRRSEDEQLDRSSKRSSRKDAHREDRSRRLEKDAHERERPREYDARRRRDHTDADSRNINPFEKNGDNKQAEPSSSAAKAPPFAPAGPRAERASKPETTGGTDKHRDWEANSPHVAAGEGPSTPTASNHTLLDRLSINMKGSGAVTHGEREDGRGVRKRPFTERDDISALDGPLESGGSHNAKRARVERKRYGGSGGGGAGSGGRGGTQFSAVQEHLNPNNSKLRR